MTISSSEIKRNMTIMLEGEVFQILEWQHRQAPKAPPTLTPQTSPAEQRQRL